MLVIKPQLCLDGLRGKSIYTLVEQVYGCGRGGIGVYYFE
jgi:hypothetical protein